MKMRRTVKDILIKIGLCLLLCLLIFFIWLSGYRKNKTNEITLKSRYTFSIRIDEDGNLLDNNLQSSDNHTTAKQFSNIGLQKIANIWLREFTNQFTQAYVPLSKSLRKIQLEDSQVLDEDTNTVMVSFSAITKDSTSEYFSSWDGILDEGRLRCEWVITYDIDDHYDGTASIYVSAIQSSEDYGISQYNDNLKAQVAGDTEDKDNKLTNYEIKDNMMTVTYNGGSKNITVPIDCKYLPFQENSTTQLMDDSYAIDASKTVFLYGGMVSSNKQIPVTILYSDDRGANWVTSEIDQIYDASYYYVNFFDEQNGVIVIGYSKSTTQESTRIYQTKNGGEDWVNVGSGPALNIVKGVRYIDEYTGFFCYDYVEGMESNLYRTKDGSKSFSKVVFEEQELDSTAANSAEKATEATSESSGNSDKESGKLTWKDVYKEALVPTIGDDNTLYVNLAQGNNAVYNNGKTAARYQSQDKGETWKYLGQFEMN